MHPLDGTKLKVVWAQDQLDAFRIEVGRYMNRHPYEVVRQRNGDTWNFSFRTTEAPPLRLSEILGYCIGNLRAALDYIAWQLAIRHSPKPFGIGSDKVYFPLARHPNKLKLKSLAEYKIPTPALDEIKRVQPYNTGYEPLGWLRDLVNEDKHRLPLLTIAHVGAGNIEVRGRGGGFSITTLTLPADRTADGLPVDDHMEVEGQAAVFITLQNVAMPREPLDRTLEQIVKCVADIVPRFERFFT